MMIKKAGHKNKIYENLERIIFELKKVIVVNK